MQHGTYRIEKVLGQGGFGITYLATDINLQREVAIKEFFPKDFCDRDETTSHVKLGTKNTAELVNRLKAKFLTEARNIAKLGHPNIIRIHAAFEENNTAYYVMEYIEGKSLSSMVNNNGPLSKKQALRYIKGVGNALEYVHTRKINHLDIKPANIMVRKSDDTPILIDFGLSKQYDSDGNQTSTMAPGFSHGFAPPEQYNEGGVKDFSPQTDLYALAATLYYLLSGIVPPQSTKLIEKKLSFPSSIPAHLLIPMTKAMSIVRSDRQKTVREFIEEIGMGARAEKKIEIKPGHQQESEPTVIITKRTYPYQNKKARLSSGKKWYIIGGVTTVAIILTLLILKKTAHTPDGYINEHEYVDLGLPSGTKWATCNVGASTPSDYGNYYAWGEVTTKPSYDAANSFIWPQIAKSMSRLKSDGIINQEGNLDISYDAAQANWGGTWRMPTKDEMEELNKECSWTWTSQGNQDGYQVTGPNGHSIFLPATGYQIGKSLTSMEKGCYYVSTPDNSGYIYGLNFNDNNHIVDWDYCYVGRSVRPVSE